MSSSETHFNASVSAPSSLRLRLDGEALVSNWQKLAELSAGECGAAVKADGYGLGARDVVRRLLDVGCEDFFVATWGEAAEIADLVDPEYISVFNGIQDGDIGFASALGAKPVLSSPSHVERWRSASGGLCDVMLDSGMNRLGISEDELQPGLLDGLDIDICMSHLASADEETIQNEEQLALFEDMSGEVTARRRSLANSAGIALGEEWHFDLTRPGLAIYGGIARGALKDHIRQVAFPEAQILQIRDLRPGDLVGYNATFEADRAMKAAIISIGYADGYMRAFSGKGAARWEGKRLPVIGRVSMDLVILDVTDAKDIAEGAWVEIEYELLSASRQSGLSQYELLTGLGSRFARHWTA